MNDATNNTSEDAMDTNPTTTQIKNFMMTEASCDTDRYLSRRDGCFNYTLLAEFTAGHFDRFDWLDDQDHEVWDLAVDVGDKFALNH